MLRLGTGKTPIFYMTKNVVNYYIILLPLQNLTHLPFRRNLNINLFIS